MIEIYIPKIWGIHDAAKIRAVLSNRPSVRAGRGNTRHLHGTAGLVDDLRVRRHMNRPVVVNDKGQDGRNRDAERAVAGTRRIGPVALADCQHDLGRTRPIRTDRSFSRGRGCSSKGGSSHRSGKAQRKNAADHFLHEESIPS